MIKALKKIVYFSYLNILISFRLKQAFFFSLMLPLFFYVVFGSLFGVTDEDKFCVFLLTGMMGMSVLSDGLFAISLAIKQYYISGFITYLKKFYYNNGVLYQVLSLLISRLVNCYLLMGLMILISPILFNVIIPFETVLPMILFIPLGLFIFSFLGLIIAFLGIRNIENSFNHVIYYIILFFSNVFYNIPSFSKILAKIGDFFPLNDVLYLFRGEYSKVIIWRLLLWSVLLPVAYFYIFKKYRNKKYNTTQ